MMNKNVNVELRVAMEVLNDLYKELDKAEEFGWNQFTIVNCRCNKLAERGMRISLIRAIARMCGFYLPW